MNSNAITGATSITATGTATLGGNSYPANTGTNGQVLTTNGAGALSWGTASGGEATLLVRASANSAQAINFASNFAAPDPATCFGNVTTNEVKHLILQQVCLQLHQQGFILSLFRLLHPIVLLFSLILM